MTRKASTSYTSHPRRGFTLVELLIACVVIAILAAVAIVAYNGMQRRTAEATIFSDLKKASEQLRIAYVRSPATFENISVIPEDFRPSGDVTIRYGSSAASGPHYSNLSPVQKGVLFYDICEELISDPYYATIHARDGSATNSVMMRCTDRIEGGGLQITGWSSPFWDTPVTKAEIQTFIDNVPYDEWWTDRQDVVRAFYTELMNRFEARGGTFPITSFWDTWANQWSGVHREDLPPPDAPSSSSGSGAYCVEAYHNNFPDSIFRITEDDKVEPGSCS